MENKVIQGLHEEFVAVEMTREGLESAVLITEHLIQDLQELSGLDEVARQVLVKLRGIHCIMGQVNTELVSHIKEADEIVFCETEKTKKGI